MTGWRPKFDSIYSGPWEYEPQHGVGIRMTGQLTADDCPMFLGALNMHGCPLQLAHRIAEVMHTGQAKETTVLSHLDFDQLAIDLAEVGIKLEIIPPRKHLP